MDAIPAGERRRDPKTSDAEVTALAQANASSSDIWDRGDVFPLGLRRRAEVQYCTVLYNTVVRVVRSIWDRASV